MAAPALAPPEVQVDQALVAQYQAELAAVRTLSLRVLHDILANDIYQ